MPLSPFVALSSFLIGQHPSLSANPFSADPTTQLLYSIEKHVFQEKITKSENQAKDILKICKETEASMAEAISTLSEEIPDVTMWSKTKDILDDVKLVSQAYKRKYEAILYSDDSIGNNTTDNNTIDNNTNTANIVSKSNTSTNANTSTSTSTSTSTTPTPKRIAIGNTSNSHYPS